MNDKVNRKVLKASGITALVMLGALLLCGILELCVLGMKGRLDFLRAGERWSSDGERYAVVSLYAEQDANISGDEVIGWTRSMDSALLEASVTPKEGGRSWAYCYAADDTLSVKGSKGTVTAEALAVGGDFFVFHQLKFKFGGGFLNDESIPRGVVLDRDLAWRVHGAENIIGMTVEIGGEEFVIVGIAERESSSGPYKHAYGDTPRIYMSYAGYRKVGSKPVTVFEAALPNAVRGFARNIFDKAVHADGDRSTVREVTDRFSLKNRFDNMKQLSYAWVSANRIEYPYWENEARVYDYRAAVLMLFEVVMAALAGVNLLLSFILLRVSGYTFIDTIKNTWKKLAAWHEKRKRERVPRAPRSKKRKDRKRQSAAAPDAAPDAAEKEAGATDSIDSESEFLKERGTK